MVQLLFSMLTMTAAFAMTGGDWVGNGGNILMCVSPAKSELFDYFEGRTKWNARISLGPNESFDEKVHFVLNRLEKINPSRAKKYRSWYSSFFQETQWLVDGKLSPIPDLGVAILPEGCELVQAAAQKPDNQILPGDKRYIIDQKVWNQLSEETKAGLVLHELLYREGIYNNHISSQKIRYLNQLVSSENFSGWSNAEWATTLKQIGFLTADYGVCEISLDTSTFNSAGYIESATAIDGDLNFFDSHIYLNARKLNFYDNAQIKSVPLRLDDIFKYKARKNILEFGGTSPAQLNFYRDGGLLSGPLSTPQSVEFNGQTILISNIVTDIFDPHVSFFPNGDLKTANLLSPYLWKSANLQLKIIGPVEFDELNNLAIDCVRAAPGSFIFRNKKWQPFEGPLCIGPQ